MNKNAISRRGFLKAAGVTAALAMMPGCSAQLGAGKIARKNKPNVVLIYADDLGYGDMGCYGGSKVDTPNIDRLAAEGLRFTNVHSTSATCTPSRYALLTGQYPWRKKGTGILKGDAAMIIKPGQTTLPSVMQKAGYTTGVVGKWHLGLGQGNIDWNKDIKPGPLDIGFDYSFLIPATGDRVPCVYVENRRVVGLDPADPIKVDYRKPIGDEPTYMKNPELRKVTSENAQHSCAIVNGIGRIGYMSGGEKALWRDEDMADVITDKAVDFIKRNSEKPFFLYFATHDIHAPRVPHERFAGKSRTGARGDVIMQFDWCIGQVVKALEEAGLREDTIIIVSSDNGPVVEEGYIDHSTKNLNGHKPAGPLRGGKYQIFDGGTRIPFIVNRRGSIKAGTSDALISQVDLAASMAAMNGVGLDDAACPDSINVIDALLGKSDKGRESLIEHAYGLAIVKGDWKLIRNSRSGKHLLYNLRSDIGEKNNLADKHPELVKELDAELEKIIKAGRSR